MHTVSKSVHTIMNAMLIIEVLVTIYAKYHTQIKINNILLAKTFTYSFLHSSLSITEILCLWATYQNIVVTFAIK